MASAADAPPVFIPPVYIVIHHTAIARSYLPEQLQAVENSHKAQGYPESPYTHKHVCYNFFVGSDGTTKQLRGVNENEGCTMNAEINGQALHIVVAGNFEEEKVPKRQAEALKNLIVELQKTYGVKNKNIIGHKDASSSACPGENLIKLIKIIRNH